MSLPEEAKKLLRLEAKNLIELRKKLRMFMYATFTGGALQIMRAKKELEDYFAKELLLRKIFTREARIKDLGLSHVIHSVTEDDAVNSAIVAGSFSNNWASAQMANVPFNWNTSLNRIVATETARSYSDVADEAAGALNLVRVWNSILDSKTCRRCRDMNGETTQPGETFFGGLEPGWTHVNCRCFSILILK